MEAYSTRMEKSWEAVKALLKEISPHFGLLAASKLITDLLLFQKLHRRLVNFRNQVETPHGMETSGFWEGREDESHHKEKYSQAVSRNSSPSGSSLAYCPAQDKGGSLKWDSVESL